MKKSFFILTFAVVLSACNNDNTTETNAETTQKKDSLPPADTDTAKVQDIVITRVFDAPVTTVWKAWTDPKQVIKWWGPKFYTACNTKIDLREGGSYIFCMKAPKDQGGQEMYTSGVYNKIVTNELIEMSQGLSDKEGNRIDPATLNMPPDFPKDIPTTLVFKETADKKTELTVTEHGWKTGQMRNLSEQGMAECLDKLGEALKHKL